MGLGISASTRTASTSLISGHGAIDIKSLYPSRASAAQGFVAASGRGVELQLVIEATHYSPRSVK